MLFAPGVGSSNSIWLCLVTTHGCEPIFLRDFSEYYAAMHEQREADLPPVDIQYSDYAHWQRDRYEKSLQSLMTPQETLDSLDALRQRIDDDPGLQ